MESENEAFGVVVRSEMGRSKILFDYIESTVGAHEY